MLAPVKSLIKRYMPDGVNGWRLYRDLVRNRKSYLHTTGWLKSLESGKPVDESGEPVPWMNYAVVSLLNLRLPRDGVMFEFGSGASTAYWSRRVARVHSVEYDQDWYERVRQNLPPNATLHYCAQDRDGAYCRSIAVPGVQFDIVLVDGRDRVNCVRESLAHLTPRGVVVLDDSSRERYQEAFAAMRQAGFSALPIAGLKPGGLGTDESTIFYRASNCLAL